MAARTPLDPGWGEVEWRVKMARPWKGNVQQAAGEVQAAQLGMEYAARKIDNHGSRQLCLLDARSAIGAIAKGRSSAFSFLRVLRRVAALSFASGIEWCPRWICSEEMPADEASRRFQPRRQRRHDWMNGARIGESKKPGPGDRPLRGRKLADNTILRYLRGFFSFYEWAVQTGWAAAIRDIDDLERAAMQWMEEQHEEGKGAYVGNCLFGAIKLLSPRSFSALLEARALLSDWNAAKSIHWPPLPLPIVLLCVSHQLEKGRKDVAVGFLLAFFCMLRVSELASLTVADIVFRDDKRFWGLQCALVVLQHTKTGDDKSAELRQAWVWPLLRSWVEQCRSERGDRARLFPSAAKFRTELAISLHHLGLGDCGFVMHSFRAGGALYLLNLEVHIEEVLRRGRWRRPESARPYVQRLRALASYSCFPAGLLERGSRIAAAPSLFLSPYF
jgi:integrase